MKYRCCLILGVCASLHAESLFVPSSFDHTVAVIDTSTCTLTTTLTTEEGSHHVTGMPNGTKIFVSNSRANTLSVIDAATNLLLHTIVLTGAPKTALVAYDYSQLFVINGDAVSMIDPDSYEVLSTVSVGIAPLGMALAPNGTRLFVTNVQDNSVSVINTVTCQVDQTIDVGIAPQEIVITPDGTRLFVLNRDEGSVTALDANSYAVLATIEVGSAPRCLVSNAQSSQLLVGSYSSNTISVMDIPTLTIVKTIAVQGGPTSLTLSSDGASIWATTALGWVYVLDATTADLNRSFFVEGAPSSIAFASDSDAVFIIDGIFRNVTAVHGTSYTILNTIEIGYYSYFAAIGDFVTVPAQAVTFTGSVVQEILSTDRIHQLTWTPTRDSTVVGYFLYRNGSLLATVSASGPHFYEDHQRSASQVDVYSLYSYNKTGAMSAPLTVSLQ